MTELQHKTFKEAIDNLEPQTTKELIETPELTFFDTFWLILMIVGAIASGITSVLIWTLLSKIFIK